MSSAYKRGLLSLFLLFLLSILSIITFFQPIISIPSSYRISVGEQLKFSPALPSHVATAITAYVEGDEQVTDCQIFHPFQRNSPIALAPGNLNLELRLFNLLPLKRLSVEVIAPVKVIAGGHSIGVIMPGKGVLVVGYAAISTVSGKLYPAKEAGIIPGDLLLKIEGISVHSDTQVSETIDKIAEGKKLLDFEVKRQGKLHHFYVKPNYCPETRRYRVGLYVRDETAGMGTLTFYERQSKKYGALGHIILDPDTDISVELKGGKIVEAAVEGVKQGKRGNIGEKIGYFKKNGEINGSVDKNTSVGIFGTLGAPLKNPILSKEIPVAIGSFQIREGPAEILTVLEGEKIESFASEIESVFFRPRSDGKAFIIKITDPKLLKKTGGIVQGMSGSPIIQDGKLIGAITHVFVNDPTRGYGVLAGLMLEEAGLFPSYSGQIKSGRFSFSAVLIFNLLRYSKIYETRTGI